MSKSVVEKTVQLVGRKTDFRGHSLWEILYGLSDYGVGRLVIRSMFQRYPEPCYYRVLAVDPTPSEPGEHGVRKIRVSVEKTWRGITQPRPIELYSSSYKADYELVPRHLEEKYTKNSKRLEERLLPSKIDFPPLLREFIRDETKETAPMMKVHFKSNFNKFTRIASADEQPTINISMGLGNPASKKLYEGIL